VATGAYDQYRGEFAEIIHRLAEMEEFDAVIAAVATEEKVEIIARSRRPEIDVAWIAQEFGGGGHAMAASATVKGHTLIEVRERLFQLLTSRYRPSLLARDVMTTPVKTIGEEATVADAEAAMTRHEVNVLPVISGRGERYLGLISRETIQKALFHKYGATPVGTFMQTDAYTAEPGTPFHEIEGRMLERNQRFVPILAGGKVIGVITRTDLLRTLHDDILRSARARMKGEPPSASFATRRNVRGLLQDRLPDRIFALLQRAGDAAERTGVFVYVVGGFVRDLLLGRRNLDVDLVVEGDGIAFARALAGETGAQVKAHERFGTAVLVFPDGFKLDVATARTEYYEYPTALPTVERSSIKKDLYRRDFTINTLTIRLNTPRFGELLDYYGGQRDLSERTIRVLHSLSFIEDPTRVFRAVRFEHRCGFHLGKETLALIRGAVKMDLFHRLSGARLLEELILLLSEDEPRRIVGRLNELGLLRFIHPALKFSSRLNDLLKSVEDVLQWYKVASLKWPRGAPARAEPWLLYLMALLEVLPAKAITETIRRLHVPGGAADKLKSSHGAGRRLARRLGGKAIQPADAYDALHGLPEETVLFLMASSKSEAVVQHVAAYLDTYRYIRPSLTGEDLKAMGLKPGPQFKTILDRLLQARLNGHVRSPAEERDLVKRIAKL
jgi:tRNA nucleotidyltransferase (CCA-adding enzyme)